MALTKFIVSTFIFTAVFNEITSGNDCQNRLSGLLKEQALLIVPCVQELNLMTGKERAEKIFCVLKCVIAKAGWLKPDGTADMEQAIDLIEKNVPESLKDKAFDVITECGSHAVGLDPNEETCQSYSALLTCLMDVGLQICSA